MTCWPNAIWLVVVQGKDDFATLFSGQSVPGPIVWPRVDERLVSQAPPTGFLARSLVRLLHEVFLPSDERDTVISGPNDPLRKAGIEQDKRGQQGVESTAIPQKTFAPTLPDCRCRRWLSCLPLCRLHGGCFLVAQALFPFSFVNGIA